MRLRIDRSQVVVEHSHGNPIQAAPLGSLVQRRVTDYPGFRAVLTFAGGNVQVNGDGSASFFISAQQLICKGIAPSLSFISSAETKYR